MPDALVLGPIKTAWRGQVAVTAILFNYVRVAGVQIVTLSEGEISEIHSGLKGEVVGLVATAFRLR
jgi:Na+-transporting NADH:ubiquinone oxidoreductase subunit NqrA